MLIDYVDFGDVIVFDTTFGTNKELRPLAVFTGFNHHRQIVIFGAALLYDETADTFSWLFETFLKAHKGKKPLTIFTNQDAAMANALAKVLKTTKHGLCTWHLNQNGIKQLGWRMKQGVVFLKDFQKCMFEYVEQMEFERQWEYLLDKYQLEDNDWLNRRYGIKEKWARCYMKYVFTLGIRSTQRSESLNSDLKSYLNCDINVLNFFKQFDRVVEQKRYNEGQAEFNARQKIPPVKYSDSPLLLQVSKRYTPTIFKLFQSELRSALRVLVKKKDENESLHEYIVCFHGSENKEFKVLFDPAEKSIFCSCRKFETMGILCCHALKVFLRLDIMNISEKYILKRWTRGVKNACTINNEGISSNEDVEQWVRRIQSQLLRLTYQASTHKETQMCMEKMINLCNKQVHDFLTMKIGLEKEDNLPIIEDNIGNLKVLKPKVGRRITKRSKPLHELTRGKSRAKTKQASKVVERRKTSSESQTPIESQENFAYTNQVYTMDLNLEQLQD